MSIEDELKSIESRTSKAAEEKYAARETYRSEAKGQKEEYKDITTRIFHAEVGAMNLPFFERRAVKKQLKRLEKEARRQYPIGVKAYNGEREEENEKWDRIMEDSRKPCAGGSA